jgi:hypothetical protein
VKCEIASSLCHPETRVLELFVEQHHDNQVVWAAQAVPVFFNDNIESIHATFY